MGLAHPHDGGGETDASTFPGVFSPWSTGDYGLNQMVFTVMSYNFGWDGAPPTGDVGHATLGAFDIAALQLMYGANNSYRTGDDNYVLPAANKGAVYWQSIWDAGGTDTISAGKAKDVIIDLRAAPLTGEYAGGFISNADGIAGGYTIAAGVVIENASGGKGNDTLIGNEFFNVLDGGKGQDVLWGIAGDDIMKGGGGNDVFYFVDGDGADHILDFKQGDKINLEFVSGVADFDDLFLTQIDKKSVLVDFDGLLGGDTLQIDGTTVAMLEAHYAQGNSDFLFVQR